MKLQGNRKFLIAAVFIVVSSVLVLFKFPEAIPWAEKVGFVILGYFGANTGEHYVKNRNGNNSQSMGKFSTGKEYKPINK